MPPGGGAKATCGDILRGPDLGRRAAASGGQNRRSPHAGDGASAKDARRARFSRWALNVPTWTAQGRAPAEPNRAFCGVITTRGKGGRTPRSCHRGPSPSPRMPVSLGAVESVGLCLPTSPVPTCSVCVCARAPYAAPSPTRLRPLHSGCGTAPSPRTPPAAPPNTRTHTRAHSHSHTHTHTSHTLTHMLTHIHTHT